MVSTQQQKFIDLLKEIFQFDQADLDFGIYRIMNQKREEINQFLKNDLVPQVREAFKKYKNADAEEIKEQIEDLEEQLSYMGVAKEDSEKYLTLKDELNHSVNISELEDEVFSDLTNFFRRYYDKGDFLSLRRYKKGVYAIPYEGEEVKFHWANADQYYVKTSEYFRDYSFKLPSGKTVHFKLVDASTEQNSNKEPEDKERRFILYEEEPMLEIDGELNIYFEYKAPERKQSQKKYNTEILEQLFNAVKYRDWLDELQMIPSSEKNKKRTLLEKHLNDYTARNTFDYFIHKDLGGFLRRELDFYIKNEIMHLDDLDTEDEKRFEQYLSKVKVIKNIGHKIIAFLEQIENFQKKLWLKKKFVVESEYCITLDRIPEKFYNEIAQNQEQINEWIELFAIDELEDFSSPITMKFLKENKYLLIDTKFFSNEFKDSLLSNIENIDNNLDGLLIHSENYQALNLLQEKYKNNIKNIYIDPPYNTQSSEILYKNTYKHSSWLTLMHNRMEISLNLLTEDFIQTVAIDEVEQERLGEIISNLFPKNRKVCVPIVHNPRGQQGTNVSYLHDFAYFIYQNDTKKYISDIKRDNTDSRNLRDSGTESSRFDAATCFYPIFVNDFEISGVGDVPPDSYHPGVSNIKRQDGTMEIWPIDDYGNEKKWRFGVDTVGSILNKLEVKSGDKSYQIIYHKDTGTMKSLWSNPKFDASEYGTKVLQDILGNDIASLFSYPKSIYTVEDCLNAAVSNDMEATTLDFFAGSGTTGHAVININRDDGGNRKYILVEMGEYFNTVTKPRIQKVIYSRKWKNAKPVDRKGSSHMFKYMKLESYEDSLNNIELQRTFQQQETIENEMSSGAREEYLLSYMLDAESKDSPSLLNIDSFNNPFDYKMRIQNGMETKKTRIDLVETFNYLIGLYVKTIKTFQDIKIVTGTLRTGEKSLIIWRNIDQVSNEKLESFFKRLKTDMVVDCIYVNGDNSLEKLKTNVDNWKVRLIEKEFKRLMFDVNDA